MKRTVFWLKTAAFTLLLMLAMACTVSAKEPDDMTFLFDLSVNGEHEITVQPGETITVVFTLSRTDSEDAYNMYAMQDEIKYDDSFVELVDGGYIVSSDIQTNDIALRTGGREFYMNYVSFSDGDQWEANKIVGSFQMKVIGTEGATTVSNENYKVSTKDGSAAYEAGAQDLSLIVSDECTVTFETNDEDITVDPVTVKYDSLLDEPEIEKKDGYEIEGWYTDPDLTEKWDFEKDTVTSNMTLYAKWTEVQKTGLLDLLKSLMPWILLVPAALLALLLWLLSRLGKYTVAFETNGGTPIDPIEVKRKQKLEDLPVPTRSGSVFGGWYKDAQLTKPWYQDIDQISKKKTRLYAKWK